MVEVVPVKQGSRFVYDLYVNGIFYKRYVLKADADAAAQYIRDNP